MTSAVVNSSPLIHLGDVGRLDFLKSLFSAVVTPSAVVSEINAKGPEDPAARSLATASWLTIVDVQVLPLPLLAWDLGAGETAVLAYALGHPGVEAIIDDQAARRCAKANDIPVCGTLGLVLRAARRGFLDDPEHVLLELRAAGMWLAPALFEQILTIARDLK